MVAILFWKDAYSYQCFYVGDLSLSYDDKRCETEVSAHLPPCSDH
jgi:hypothetical protein